MAGSNLCTTCRSAAVCEPSASPRGGELRRDVQIAAVTRWEAIGLEAAVVGHSLAIARSRFILRASIRREFRLLVMKERCSAIALSNPAAFRQ